MAARQASVDSELFGNDISKLWPISYEGQSDTACFDNALEFLVRGGYSLAHAMMMLIPEAWAGNPLMDDDRRAFYEYHAALMEPWDGPAAVCLHRRPPDRRDARPQRPAPRALPRDRRRARGARLRDGRAADPGGEDRREVAASAGQDAAHRPGARAASSPTTRSRATLATAHPYREWLKRTQIVLEDLQPVKARESRTDVSLLDRQQAFGYTPGRPEAPDAADGRHRPGGGRLDGHRHADLGALGQVEAALHLFQAELRAGDEPADRSDPRGARHEPRVVHRAAAEHPRSRGHLAPQAARSAPADPDQRGSGEDPLHRPFRGRASTPRPSTSPIRPSRARPAWTARSTGCATGPRRPCTAATTSSSSRTAWSGRTASRSRRCSPRAAVHNYLIRKGLRTSVGLVVESGEPREVHHFSCLAGYGAEAINPYLAFETLAAMQGASCRRRSTSDEIVKRYIKSIDKGMLKVMSKMGISTYQSYCGAQIFDAVGLQSDFVEPRLLRHGDDDRRHRHGRDRRGDGAPSSRRLRRRADLSHRARCRRRVRLPHARRGPCLEAGHGGDAAACRAPQRAGPLSRIRAARERAGRPAQDHPRPVPHQDRARRAAAPPFRWTRSSRRRRSCAASRPARCRSARSPRRRTRRWRSP